VKACSPGWGEAEAWFFDLQPVPLSFGLRAGRSTEAAFRFPWATCFRPAAARDVKETQDELNGLETKEADDFDCKTVAF